MSKMNVLLSVQEKPHVPSRQIARELEITQSSVTTVLKSQKCNPYRMTIHQELAKDDPDRKLDFCKQIIDLLDLY